MSDVKRYGMVIELRKEKIEEYKQLHAAVWPGILKMITECNIRNYSIYLRELQKDKFYLFSYFEYIGNDFKADMEKNVKDPETQRWLKETGPCQLPILNHTEGKWWSNMEEIFHTD